MKKLGLAIILLMFLNIIFWSYAHENNTNLTIGRTSFFIPEGCPNSLSEIIESDATNTSRKKVFQLDNIWRETADLSAMTSMGNGADETIILYGQPLKVSNSLTKTYLGFDNVVETKLGVITGGYSSKGITATIRPGQGTDPNPNIVLIDLETKSLIARTNINATRLLANLFIYNTPINVCVDAKIRGIIIGMEQNNYLGGI